MALIGAMCVLYVVVHQRLVGHTTGLLSNCPVLVLRLRCDEVVCPIVCLVPHNRRGESVCFTSCVLVQYFLSVCFFLTGQESV